MLYEVITQTPENTALDPLVKQLRGQVASGEDSEKQARIDQMIKELLENRDQEPPLPSEERWTSSPLTVWVMDFETLGYAVREGDRLLLNAGLTDFLVENRRAQVVEREILEKLLTELKLGASRLADRETALVITSYSIHYTKLYDPSPTACPAPWRGRRRRRNIAWRHCGIS